MPHALERQGPRITYLVKRVEQGCRALLVAGLRDHGISLTQYTALSVLRSRGDLSSAQLSRRAFVSMQAMNEIVATLERRGLIERSPSPRHRKVLVATLTEDGRRMLDECEPLLVDVERVILSHLSDSEVRALEQGLGACAAALDEHFRRTARPATGSDSVVT